MTGPDPTFQNREDLYNWSAKMGRECNELLKNGNLTLLNERMGQVKRVVIAHIKLEDGK